MYLELGSRLCGEGEKGKLTIPQSSNLSRILHIWGKAGMFNVLVRLILSALPAALATSGELNRNG